MALTAMLMRAYRASVEGCVESIVSAIPDGAGGRLLDLGCGDGSVTRRLADRLSAQTAYGIEVLEFTAIEARRRGIAVVVSDLNRVVPLSEKSVDVVTANQVIEHVIDTDLFVSEIRRLLRPRGLAIISTNNLASWHNVAALVVGAQPFPSDVSRDSSIGKLLPLFSGDPGRFATWTHLRIFSYRALAEMLELHGLTVEEIHGIGYYPLPARAAARVAKLDPRHAAYITAVARRR